MGRLAVLDSNGDRLVQFIDCKERIRTDTVETVVRDQLKHQGKIKERGINRHGCREWWVCGSDGKPVYVVIATIPDPDRIDDSFRERLERIVKKAGEPITSHKKFSVSSKEGHGNYVTDIDRSVQEYLETALTNLWPDSVFIGEEKEQQNLTDDPTWIVDPIDGTANFIHDYRMSAISIALCENRKPILGMICQPYTEELFYAETGKGAFLNGKPIHVSETAFSEALVAFGTAPYYEELVETTVALAGEFLHSCSDLRRSGSAALDLAYLACGRIDAYFEMRLKPWDYAAGALIVQEAGGKIQMPLIGDEMDYDQSTAIVAANPVCMDSMIETFWKHNGT